MGFGADRGGVFPDVSVVIPVFDQSAQLEHCLDALSKQTYPRDRFNVVVVDNGSSEDIRSVCRRNDGVRYILESQRGSYAARNAGIKETTSSVLAFTDADCIPSEDWLEKGVAALGGVSGPGLVGGRIKVFPIDPNAPTPVETYEMVLAFPQQHYIEDNRYAATANLFTRRSTFERVGVFDATRRSGGDAEWGRRVDSEGYELRYADDAVVLHPARRTFGEIRRKERRVAGGVFKRIVETDPSLGYFAYRLARVAWYAAKRSAALAVGGRVSGRRMNQYPLMDRATTIWVIAFRTCVRIAELLRLRISGGVGAKR